MQVGVADPAGLDLDQHLVGTGAWRVDFLRAKRTSRLTTARCAAAS